MSGLESIQRLARNATGVIVLAVVLAQPTWVTLGLAWLRWRKEGDR